RRLRGGHRGCSTPRVPVETRVAAGNRGVARAVPAALVAAPRRAPTPSRSNGSANTNDERDEEDTMTERPLYAPGPATAARVEKDGDTWRLVVEKQLRQPPEKVWRALIDPAQLREWAPFDADGSLGTVGATVKLTTVGAPGPHVTESTVTRADAPN